MQPYINQSEASIAIAKFRMGDTKLGNRETPAIKDCRLCSEGKGNNNEEHLIFECEAANTTIKKEMPILHSFKVKHEKEEDTNKKLKMLLGGDKCKKIALLERGKELAKLLAKIQDMLKETDFVDTIEEMRD